uniref:Ferredoxin thioredoxin reductase alpha chain domain-containing protein n=1 Tax=Pycnococcus provasolii TaxID=41880 RepID=A0A7S2YW15_9CHLO|mmetsp:Transcript_2338/g.5773  ORF Transcript_2338/g.5773 Transcript_2338/m.5773 type:complete len:118 (+) Transcript_2338:96-449(+)
MLASSRLPKAACGRRALHARRPSCSIRSSRVTVASVASPVPEGTKVKVTADVTISHVARLGDYSLKGQEGEVMKDVSVHKDQPTNATMPLRCKFVINNDGADVKVIAHLAEDEVEML